MSDNPGENTRHQNQIEGVGSVSAVQINPRTCTRNDKQELKRIDSIFSVRKRTSVTMFVKKKTRSSSAAEMHPDVWYRLLRFSEKKNQKSRGKAQRLIHTLRRPDTIRSNYTDSGTIANSRRSAVDRRSHAMPSCYCAKLALRQLS